jgi:small subunit ribosomal protein S4
MTRYTGPKNRIARKYGANIFGRLRNPLLHKSNPPGQHGSKRKKKSDFGIQLDEKQKLRAIYGMLTQKQLLQTYGKALDMEGNTSHNLLILLESRLDNIVYRLRFGSTIFAAGQLVSHGHILVNGKRVDRRSFQVKPGMIVSIAPSVQKNKIIEASQANIAREIPSYLWLAEDKCSGKMEALPLPEQIPLPVLINVPFVCEYLSRFM